MTRSPAKIAPPRVAPEPDERAVEIGARIRKLRDQRKFTNPSIARMMRVQVDAINRMMRGESLVQAVKLADLARVLQVTPNDLFGFSAGVDRDLVRQAFEGALAEFLPSDQAAAMVQAVLAAIDAPEVPAADRGTTARVRAADEVRRLGLAKRLL